MFDSNFIDNEPVYVDIFGSCVSREPFNHIPIQYNVKVDEYIHKQSLWFLDNVDNWPKINENEVISAHNFIKRSVCTLLNGTAKARLDDSRSNWIIIDDYYFRQNILKITNNKTGEYRLIQCPSEVNTELFRIVNTTQKFRDYSIELIDAVPNYLLQISKIKQWLVQRYGSNIIMIDAEEANRDYSNNSKVFNTTIDSTSNVHRIRATKTILDNIDCWYIPLQSELLSRDGMPVHYGTEIYEYVGNLIGTIIRNPSSFYQTYNKLLIDLRFKLSMQICERSNSLYQVLSIVDSHIKNRCFEEFEKDVEMLQQKIELSNSGLIEKKLGFLYSVDKTPITNYETAKEWYERAFEKGCNILGDYYALLNRINTQQSIEELITTAKKYADAEEGNSCGWLARIYRDGKGVDKNTDLAIFWMRKASKSKVMWAKNELFDLLWLKNDPEDYLEMIDVITPVVDSGNGGGIARLGRCYRDGKGVEANLEKAMELMQIAVDKKTNWITNELFDVMWTINDVDVDKKAFKIIEEYSKTGDANALARLGKCYHYGRGAEIDLLKAAALMDEAAAKNIDWANTELTLIKSELKGEHSPYNSPIVESDMNKTAINSRRMKIKSLWIFSKILKSTKERKPFEIGLF